MTDRQRLLRLQKRIYHLLKAEADNLMGETPEPIRRYERTFQRDFARLSRGRVTQVEKDQLIRAIRAADVTFISDFHAFGQAQRTAIRVLRQAVRPSELWYIGLEMIPSHLQDALDSFQAGRLTLEKFHQLIRYKETWGFPWENYAPIFDWARANQVRLIALNKPRELLRRPDKNGMARAWIADESELHLRDQWAAGVITDLYSESPRPKMIVLYGELHLAASHLPRQLIAISKRFLHKPLKSVVLHQNHDRLYWDLAKRHQDFHADIFRLKQDAYCVFSGTPWTKLQSLISWAEGAPDSGTENAPRTGVHPDFDEDDGLVENETDYLSLVRHYSDTVAEFIDLPPPSYETMEVVTIDDADIVDSALATAHLPTAEHTMVKFLVRNNHRVLIPRADVAYLGSPSHNSAAELAAVRLFRRATRTDTIWIKSREDFFRLILESAFGFCGSLVINPRRKCDSREDHLRRLDAIAQGAPELNRLETASRKLALAFLSLKKPWTLDENRSSLPQPLRDLDQLLTHQRQNPALLLAARYIGQALGKRIHHAVMEGAANTGLLRRIAAPYIKRNGGETPLFSFEERYLESLRLTSASTAATAPLQRL